MSGKNKVDQDDLAAAWGTEMGLDEDVVAGETAADDLFDSIGEEGDEQDDLAAAWGAELGMEDGGGDGDAAAQWASLVSGGLDDGDSERPVRKLTQSEIDSLLGFQLGAEDDTEVSGVRAIVNSGIVAYERLPMLEIIFDRLVRLMTSSLRNFTSDNVEVTLDSITTIRFGDYLNSIPLPAMLAVFHAEEWDNYGIITAESNLIYAVVDVLLGGRGSDAIRIEGRPYTTIEGNLVKRMIEVVLSDAENAFRPLSPVRFRLDRMETNPRFAAIAREANAAIRVELRIDMEDRGGRIEVVMPHSTLEPIRELLLQGFMGEKFGNDTIWEEHLAREIWNTKIPVDAVLTEMRMSLQKLLQLKVGDTVMLDCRPSDPVSVRSGHVELAKGYMGRKGDHIAIRLNDEIRSRKAVEA